MPTCRAPRRVGRTFTVAIRFVAILLAACLGAAGPAIAQKTDVERILSAIVKVSAEVPAEARTADSLGTEREGSGVVIDDNGLVLTIGYLILESMGVQISTVDGRAFPAEVVAYDHDTGFGLVRTTRPPSVEPLPLGDSEPLEERDRVLVASYGGQRMALGAFVVSRRDFAGSWEYLLERAIFTSPPHLAFGGAALIDQEGSLVGIGSLIVPNAAGDDRSLPGNMFVPIDALKPILADLLEDGRRSGGSRPWLGLYAQEHQGRVFAVRVPRSGPAHAAGVQPGDIVLGVGGKPVSGLADYYRTMWSLGEAGVSVPLQILRDNSPDEVTVKSIDRQSWLRSRMSY